MQILKFSYEFPPIGGGGAQVVDGLSKELIAQGHSVDLVTMKFRDLPRYEVVDGIKVHRVPCLRAQASICHPYEMATYLIGALPVIKELTNQKRFDINHTHFIFPDALLAYRTAQFSGLPYIVTAHGSDVPGYNPNRFKLLHRLLIPVWKRVVNGSEQLVSPSQTLANLISLQEPLKPVTVIPNGIQIQKYDLSNKDPERLLVVSRYFQRKGVQYLLRALDGVRTPYKVDIIGEGPYLVKLKEIAGSIQTAAEITFHGWIDNKTPRFRELFERASIFVFPSEAENFPMVLLEAMMAGLAIITTKGTGCEEVVEDTALLVPIKDVDMIRSALDKLNQQPALVSELGRRALVRVEREFAWPVVAKRYISIYERIREERKAELGTSSAKALS